MFYTVFSRIGDYLKEAPYTTWTGLTVNNLVAGVINLVSVVAVVVFFFLLLFGGIRWITAGGDKEALAKAQGTITSALIGIVIVFSAWAILSLVKYFFGITPPPSPPPCSHYGGPCGKDQPPCCKPYFCTAGQCLD